ncbi:MAG: class I SAM-dependent methyltransferase [Bacteroidota bacterium]
MNTNKMNLVENKLKALHKDAQKDSFRIGKGVVKSIFCPIQPADFEHAYLPISSEQGHSLYQLIVDNNCKNIVEFGTSFGISTIYLANAVRQTGGKVITTELLESKATKAQQNIDEAGLSDFVEVRVGDAMETLKDHGESIDFLFLDGWKDLYLPLYCMLEPQFHEGTCIC